MIYVLGSINFDLVIFLKKFPEIGETVKGNSIFFNLGGKGANQAITIKKLNGDVLFIGRVGDDYFGKYLINNLNQFNLNYEIKIDNNLNTGIAIINVDEDGKNKIVIYEGANSGVRDEEIDFLKDKIKGEDLLLMQGEIPFETITNAVEIAKKSQAKVIFDPAPAKLEFKNLFPYLTYITPNEVEIQMLTHDISELDDKIDFLINSGVYGVIVKLGEKGIVYKDRDGRYFKLDAYKVNAVDTTAAGDIFNGAFALCLNKNFDLKYSLKFSQAASAISVTRKGATISCPDYNEVIKFLEERDEKNNN
ncbi:MAG TPA: ribokinase [Caldisericia bacterium]|nr:ribokinase [Caldisericia bacterium]HQL66297.1 ribokinase [Caldisericia bacterium]HQP00019.1 ribokinase [Caldisericia bacterium]